jgi:RNA polymerase sigma-70 factor (ECF subfamily)
MAEPAPQSVAPRPVTPHGRFEEIYDANVVPIYRFVHARVGNRPDAEDITAQVFTRAVEQLDTTRDDRQIVSWLYRVAQNAIADYWRAFYRLPVIGSDQVAPGWEPMDHETDRDHAHDESAATRVRSLLDRLPERYARVLDLRFLQRLSVAETAERMGISNGNAKILQYRALRRAALLGDDDG